eukprot:Hpha_TRINITY_DN5572_c0_g1::TRINITY_DN5572_c0_g1_i1::g.93857::m.93857
MDTPAPERSYTVFSSHDRTLTIHTLQRCTKQESWLRIPQHPLRSLYRQLLLHLECEPPNPTPICRESGGLVRSSERRGYGNECGVGEHGPHRHVAGVEEPGSGKLQGVWRMFHVSVTYGIAHRGTHRLAEGAKVQAHQAHVHTPAHLTQQHRCHRGVFEVVERAVMLDLPAAAVPLPQPRVLQQVAYQGVQDAVIEVRPIPVPLPRMRVPPAYAAHGRCRVTHVLGVAVARAVPFLGHVGGAHARLHALPLPHAGQNTAPPVPLLRSPERHCKQVRVVVHEVPRGTRYRVQLGDVVVVAGPKVLV